MFRSASGQSCLRLLITSLAFLVSSGTQLAQAQDRAYNYILTRTYKSMLKDPAVAVSAGEANLAISYMDGLGRLKQQVNIQAGKDNKDLVAPIEYNSLGQLINTYLPVKAESQNGAFQKTAPTLVTNYYNDNSRFSDPTSRVYSESRFEASPLSRPTAQVAAGTDKPVTSVYGVNTEINVRRYKAGLNLTDISRDGYYDAGQLTFVQKTDEEGAITSEYTDKQGLLILRRSGSGQLVTNTYYAYNDRNQLRAVLQPMFETIGTPGSVDLANFAFLYHYDERGRLDQKQVPGGGITTLGYDTRDRLVTTLDAKGQRFYYHYDGLDRQTEMGICLGACDPLNPSSTTNKNLLIHTYYDSYNTTTENNQTLAAEFPFVNGTAAYSWTPASDFIPADMGTAPRKGQVTGHCVRMLNADGNLSTLWSCDVIYYDDRYRPMQTARRLPYMGTNGLERVSYKRDFIGKVTAQKTTQSWDSQSYTVEKLYNYDQAERLTDTRMRTSSSGPNALPMQDIVINAQRYNEIGQLETKYLHAADTKGTQAMEQLTYKRNVRGWLREHRSIANSNRVFKVGFTYKGNGNIASQEVQTPTVGLATYAFDYDVLNRLNSGHGEAPKYDLNGNIISLKRTNAASTLIDDLTYSYSGNRLSRVTDATNSSDGFNNGSSGTSNDYAYDANGNLTKDLNRGIGSDTQEAIFYNYLNLPCKVVGSKTVEYIYDATGQKRKSSVVSGTESTLYEGIFEYDGSNLPTRIATDEGQLVKVGSTWQWQYYLKDHLGNVRVVLDQSGNVVQEADYYPFGLAQAKNPTDLATSRLKNKYLYLTKELQAETGWLDLQARMYDPIVGRFMSVDQLAEKGKHWSPYLYGFGNPLRFVDPDGRWPYPINIRSFAPFKEFGGWFAGDNRGYSTSSSATSRLAQSFIVDPSARSYSKLQTYSSPSSHPVLGTATAKDDRGSISNFTTKTNKDGSNTISFTSSMAGHNPLVKGSPDIDLQTKFTMTENVKAGTLNVRVVQSGDAFPAAETFMSDTNGKQLFIGVSPANGNPYKSLPLENDRPMMSAEFTVTMDSYGGFTGVKQGNTNYTTAEWNKMNENKAPVLK